MKLSDLLIYDDITIQCHDNPDADAIASGFGAYIYFKEHNKNVRFVYSGSFEIKKSNLLILINELQIPIEYVKPDGFEVPQLLLTVDCQYGEGNVTRLKTKRVAVIDHHQVSGELPELSDVRTKIGSCSTIIWSMLVEEGMDVNHNRPLATSLYYGLMTDTNNFAEMAHPLDRDLRDDIVYDTTLVRRLIDSNLSLDELTIAGNALINMEYDEDTKSAIVEAEPCDPNILGVISDMMLEVDTVNTCLVYCVLPFGIKLSVRSCVKENKASDLVAYLTDKVGSGGGHLDKAGGFIQKELLGNADANEFLKKRLKDYFVNSDIFYCGDKKFDVSDMVLYKKKPIPVGYVKVSVVVPVGELIKIRTLEGDMERVVDEDLYIMIGIIGEVYFGSTEKLHRTYTVTEEPFLEKLEYEPKIKLLDSNESIKLLSYAKKAIAAGGVPIYCKEIDKLTKIFTQWDPDSYMKGVAGDMLAVRTDDLTDAYIIRRDIFDITYERV